MEKIFTYMNKRGLSFIETDKKPWYNRELWYDEISRSYHNVFLFARNLGFDPLTFMPLNDEIFRVYPVQRADGTIIWTSDYRRHHLDPTNKESMYLKDLVQTDVWTHPYWEKFGEANARLLLEKFAIMTSQKGSGDNGAWTKQDILELFKDTPTEFQNDILYHEKTGWFNREFDEKLREFNTRKNIYESRGLEALIVERKYNNLYGRFYQVVADDKGRHLWLFARPLTPYGLIDYTDIIGLEFYLSKNPEMVQKFMSLINFKYF